MQSYGEKRTFASFITLSECTLHRFKNEQNYYLQFQIHFLWSQTQWLRVGGKLCIYVVITLNNFISCTGTVSVAKQFLRNGGVCFVSWSFFEFFF